MQFQREKIQWCTELLQRQRNKCIAFQSVYSEKDNILLYF